MTFTNRAKAKQRTHEQILKAAGEILKLKGIDGTTIDEVMAATGLTRGTFYAYFKDKNDLLMQAFSWMISDSNHKISNRVAGSRNALGQFLEIYLSSEHRNNVEDGCPIAPLSGEFARASLKFRREFSKLLSETIDHRRNLLPRDGQVLPREQWIGLMSTYIGALVLSRACQGEPLSDEILKSAKNFLERGR